MEILIVRNFSLMNENPYISETEKKMGMQLLPNKSACYLPCMIKTTSSKVFLREEQMQT